MLDLAYAAARRTLDFFGDDTLAIDRKGDATPVTEADRSAERLIREQLAQSFGDDSILGEEFDERQGTSNYRWIIDPIDGTKSCFCGVPLYATLVGLEHGPPNEEGEIIAGAIVIPALNESAVAADELGTWHRQPGRRDWGRVQVSSCKQLGNATFVTSQVDTFADRDAASAFTALETQSSITRTWGDAYGYLLVATGRAEIMVDPIVSPWDVAAVLPVIEQAGGRFSDWSGQASIRGGTSLGTNGHLHDQVLEIIAGETA